ncbi:MAG TPA: multiheme c-type cytochrome [Gemmatimonadaceae bacterium]
MIPASSRPALAGLLCVVLGACTEKIVYKDLPDFVDPPAGAVGFLGYSDNASRQTTCGNCHSGKQARWKETAHASAWSDLAASGAQAQSCEGCHSVGHRGNTSTDQTAGYAGTQNVRYEDVQCESCHGPGLTHVTNPDAPGNKPLASLAVGSDLTNGCGECHSGTHQPFVEEWAASRHARIDDHRAENASCVACHEPRGVLAAWGVKTVFLESEEIEPPFLGITCVVCHDPHDASNPKQLRFPIDVPELESNLCMKCHYKRAEPEVNSSRGPHSPQGPVLLGEAGWTPPGFAYPPKSLVGSHGSDRNPKLCATCHVNSYAIGDFHATGHSFQPIPCVDAQGVPTGATTCEDTERSFKACVLCHLTETAARSARAVAKDRLTRLADEIDVILAQVPSSEFSTTDNRISTAEGSKFNALLARERGSAIHNPFLVEALLAASIDQLEADYGLSARVGLSLKPALTPPPSLKTVK